MKKLVCLVTVFILAFTSSINVFALQYGEEHEGYYESSQKIFSDVPVSHWAYEETKRCREQGWFDGYPNGKFLPDASITRAEAVKVFVTFLSRELTDVKSSRYHDVDINEWYAPYIQAGEDLFPQKWKNNNAFQPNMPITREDTVYALVTALGYDKYTKYADESVLNMFTDKNSISSAMTPYLAVAISNSLVSGFEDDTIRAQDALTRAQFCALLYRATFVGPQETEAKLLTVNVNPTSQQSMVIGESFSFSARGEYTDGTVQAYSDLKPYDSENSGIVKIDNNTVTAVKEGTCVIKFDNAKLSDISVIVSVMKPSDAPVIKIFNEPSVTTEETVTLSGTVTDKTGTEINLTCNSKDVMVNNGSFSYTVTLSVGENSFEFVAENDYGNTGTKVISIKREEEKPKTVTMINVVGQSESYAKDALEKLGLKVSSETVWNENADKGTIISQSIVPNTEVEMGTTVKITVCGGQNDWVGWIDNLPNYVTNQTYVIEEKTQYRYKKQEHKTSSASYLDGWSLKGTKENWGGWSSWSQNAVSSSATREVETKNVANPQQTKTQWHYTRYYGLNPSTGKYVSWPWLGTNSKTYQESGWRDTPLENRGKADNCDAICYKDPSDNISIWWWNETTRTVSLPTTYHTEYRYRDKNTTYEFIRWGEWSDWSDKAISENDTTEVETKKVYRYKFK